MMRVTLGIETAALRAAARETTEIYLRYKRVQKALGPPALRQGAVARPNSVMAAI